LDYLERDTRPKRSKFGYVAVLYDETGKYVLRWHASHVKRELSSERGNGVQLGVAGTEPSQYVFDVVVQLLERVATRSILPSDESKIWLVDHRFRIAQLGDRVDRVGQILRWRGGAVQRQAHLPLDDVEAR
jgi:hypothetical protein